jgi:D-hydroxyproline dehydrogenase subunit alpha
VADTLHTDIAVIGAGPAGIATSIAAAEAGRDVLLLDSAPRPGGQIWRHNDSTQLPAAAVRAMERLERSGARFLPHATVMDAERRELRVEVSRRAATVVAGTIILATGARELFLPFPGWTLPNVIGLGGAQALAKAGVSFAGKRVVVAGSGPLVPAVAALLARRGAKLLAVAEQAPRTRVMRYAATLALTPGKLAEAAHYRMAFATASYRLGVWVAEATGDGCLAAVVLTDGVRRWSYDCDILCVAYGLIPNTELAALLGCRIGEAGVEVDSRQRTSVEGVLCAGEPTGVAGVESALLQGEIAGREASGFASPVSRRSSFAVRQLAAAFAPRPELAQRVRPDTIVCRCEDATMGEIGACDSMRQAKLVARVGMGPCQGRICGPALQLLRGWQPGSVRPPVFPVTVEVLADTGLYTNSQPTETAANAEI